ncbi:hypothetical protein OG320_03580 [Microbispora sp. NBC_01189]|uniref:hypothetical protein n=1 Tax=Microbispora sp. NBC_01189 TaxID=2903583 RepID=UPI002E116675|nr:hypothetical protein OG320_03580 [Microbispora sp. NBC_01189]
MVRHIRGNQFAGVIGCLGRPALAALTIAISALAAHPGHAKATLPQDTKASAADGGSRNGNGSAIRLGNGRGNRSFMGLGDQINYGGVHQYGASLGEGSVRNEVHVCD